MLFKSFSIIRSNLEEKVWNSPFYSSTVDGMEWILHPVKLLPSINRSSVSLSCGKVEILLME